MAAKAIVFRAFLLVSLLVLFAVPFHYWTVDRKGVMRALSPIPAFFASWTIKCSSGSPTWQKEIMNIGVWTLRAPASQSAFVDAEGQVHHCEAGWQGDVFFSPLVSKDSLFQYGSLTKPVTSSLAVRLVDQGVLDYDYHITEMIGDLGPHDEPKGFDSVTLGNLMTHSAGISGEMFSENRPSWCPYSMNQILNQKAWDVPEGTHRYSNLGYCLLGAAISKATGENYRTAVERAFNLDSYGIRFVDAAHSEGWVVPDYRYHDFYRDDVMPSFDYYAVSATAGMGGSATGYAKLMHDLLDSYLEGVLTEKSALCDSRKIRNCYGKLFYLYETPFGELFNAKGGHMPGYSSELVINESREVFVWLGNTDTPNASSGINTKKFIDLLSERGF
ncbi:MAG: beta-lactamase family protein [Oceanospirillales bacterium]|nr:beta-lactamase family protein [Oceanospirillales bacterium]